MERVTIYEVARAAGVSVATVSRALNGGPVAPATRERVLEIARRLGYRPDRLAQGLATGKSRTVGVVIPDATGPLYGQMQRGLADVLTAAGFGYIATESRRDPGREAALLDEMLARKVEALVLVGSGLPVEALRARFSALPPLVLIEREGAAAGVPTYQIENEAAAYRATRALLLAGHTRIAHIKGLRRAGREREAGFLRALAEAGLKRAAVLAGDFTEEGGYRAARALLARGGFTAIFAANDRMALGVYRAAFEAGLRIPEDLSVVGFDDLAFSAYLTPPLSTLRQPAYELGRRAGEAVLSMLGGGTPESAVLPCAFVARASVARMGGAV